VPMKVEDDHHDADHAHIAVPKSVTPLTYASMSKHLLRGNAAITTGLSSNTCTHCQNAFINDAHGSIFRYVECPSCSYGYSSAQLRLLSS
jgi:hypothetical protein